jgi:hypothetical protein
VAHLLLQADALHLPLADRSVDLVFGSPPYLDCRSYGRNDIMRGVDEWVGWMLAVTEEAMRVCRGPVLWVAAGKLENHSYYPACEGLMWEWWKRGGRCQLHRPCYWNRHGIPGSGGTQWFRADIEYVMAFKRTGPLPWADNKAMGKPPRWAPGGAMSHREQHGARVNRHPKASKRNAVTWITTSAPDGSTFVQPYIPPDIANPGNLVRTNAGKGHMGHDLAHENEAPFPEDLAEWFVRSLCPPDGVCLDPFSGSGTTVAVCERLGRHGIGGDLRRSQGELAQRRIERPHQPRPKTSRKPRPEAQAVLFD